MIAFGMGLIGLVCSLAAGIIGRRLGKKEGELEIRENAVQHGFAHWETWSDGTTSFRWEDYSPKRLMKHAVDMGYAEWKQTESGDSVVWAWIHPENIKETKE